MVQKHLKLRSGHLISRQRPVAAKRRLQSHSDLMRILLPSIPDSFAMLMMRNMCLDQPLMFRMSDRQVIDLVSKKIVSGQLHLHGDETGRSEPGSLSFSQTATDLLQSIETLRVKPYDDQTGQEVSNWVEGATIGYGHLVKQAEWETYKSGITDTDARNLFDIDAQKYISAVQDKIKVKLSQNEFDALVILAFNIGIGSDGFKGSSVAKLVNDPAAATPYKDLEAAWKAWNKSQKKVNKGLINRRNCEWDIYTKGIYVKW